MVLWISLGLFIVSLIISIVMYIVFRYKCDKEWTYEIPMVVSAISGLAVVVFVLFLIVNFLGIDGYHEALKQQQIELHYQVEHMTVMSKYSTMKNIEKWNTMLAKKKKDQRDFWIGVLVPNIYDDLDYIRME